LGKENAIYLPSGTMCNQIAVRIYCRPGDEIIMDETAHNLHFETGGSAALSGASIFTVPGERGIYSANQLKEAIRPADNHFPRTKVALIEQTSNLGGGSIWPLDKLNEVCEQAKYNGLACHMDGARLLNACVASGISAKKYAENLDSVWIDFSKGLGAPVGAALAGSNEFIEEAWRWKHQFGGAMRQAGIIAAGAIYALEHHIDRLAEDHKNAQILAQGLSGIDGIEIEPVDTNIIFFDVTNLGITAKEFGQLTLEKGVFVSSLGKTRVRAVTHLDVSQSQILQAIEIITDVVQQIKE
jgi:threonine aldolase